MSLRESNKAVCLHGKQEQSCIMSELSFTSAASYTMKAFFSKVAYAV